MVNNRFNRLDEILGESHFQGLVLNAGPSLKYFTGLDFHLMERPVVLLYVPGKVPVLILPRLERAKIQEKEWLDPFFYDENPAEWSDVFRRAIDHAGVSRMTLGAEPLQFRLLEHTLMTSSGKISVTDGSPEIARLRSIKDASEIEKMQKAVDIAQDALRSVLPLIKRGIQEKEVASELVLQLFRNGSDASLPFSPIVSSGPNGANPHAKPSERILEEGDLLVIDWGASHDGYVSDLTRTFAIGEINSESQKIHEVVQLASSAGRAAGIVGATCGDIDRAARQIIDEAGYGEYFTHRTGHGIGMQCHEEPYIRSDNEEPIQVGMAYTVEPGIYLTGMNGVRIEDDIVVTADGPRSLSNLPRRIIQLG